MGNKRWWGLNFNVPPTSCIHTPLQLGQTLVCSSLCPTYYEFFSKLPMYNLCFCKYVCYMDSNTDGKVKLKFGILKVKFSFIFIFACLEY